MSLARLLVVSSVIVVHGFTSSKLVLQRSVKKAPPATVTMLFDKFGAEAVNVLMYAQQETRRVGMNEVGTEHVFMGILAFPGNADSVLRKSKIKLPQVQDYFNSKNSVSEPPLPRDTKKLETMLQREQDPLPFTPKSKALFRLALNEAEGCGSIEVGSEHLLLAVLKDGSSQTVASVLEHLQVDVISLTENVRKVAKKSSSEPVGVGGGSGSSDTATLESCGTDLTALAANNELDPCVGRDAIVERVLQSLVRRRKSNPCLVGEPGVGKTAIAEGLAIRLAEGQVPRRLNGKRLHTLEISALVAGTKYRGEFEDRLQSIINEVMDDGETILFIDELHTLIGAGAGEGAVDAANILKTALARSGIQVLGATTLGEYRKYIEKDPALERRFQPIDVPEPSITDTIQILDRLRPLYEDFHGVQYAPAAVEAAATYSSRYINDRFLPDKAIDLLDEAGASAHVASAQSYMYNDTANSASIVEEETQITEDDVARVVSTWTGIPVNKLSQAQSLALLDLEDTLHRSVVGQHTAVKSIARAIRRARIGLRPAHRPVASFFFAGPTGVGKTLVAKALAETYFGSEDAMIRFDMGEFAEPHTVARFLGSPAGYVGFDEGGQLTNAVRRRPHSLILFDEIEKAHSDIYNALLGLLEDGRIQDAKGRVVDFTNVIVIFTSNTGSQVILDNTNKDHKPLVYEALRANFRPEFLNRIDEIVIFDMLSDSDLTNVLDLAIADVTTRTKESIDRKVEVSDNLRAAILLAASDRRYGARPLRRAVQRLLEDPIAESAFAARFDSEDPTPLFVDFDANNDDVLCSVGSSSWRVAIDDFLGGGIEENAIEIIDTSSNDNAEASVAPAMSGTKSRRQ